HFSPPFSVESVEDRDEHDADEVEAEDRDDRRQVERPERRQDAPEDAEVGLADVVEEALDPVQPDRVGKPEPRRDDVGEEDEDVDRDEDRDEVLDLRDCVAKHELTAHAAKFGSRSGVPLEARLATKTPPESSELPE